MKTKILKMMLLTVCLYIGKSQAQQSAYKQHNLSFGPQASYNLEHKKALYGGGIGYEFRLNKKWGFTANANLNMGIEEKTNSTSTNQDGSNVINISNNNVSIGSKYYLNRFYISANFGYGEERQRLKFDDSRATRWESKRGFYQAYAVGYQIPLQQNTLEVFASGGGINDLNITTGVRFNFGIGKK